MRPTKLSTWRRCHPSGDTLYIRALSVFLVDSVREPLLSGLSVLELLCIAVAFGLQHSEFTLHTIVSFSFGRIVVHRRPRACEIAWEEEGWTRWSGSLIHSPKMIKQVNTRTSSSETPRNTSSTCLISLFFCHFLIYVENMSAVKECLLHSRDGHERTV